MDLSWMDVLKLIVLMVVFVVLMIAGAKSIYEAGRNN